MVKRLEAEQTSRNVQLATTQGLLSTKGALLSDLVRLQQVKQGKVSELTTTVENQVAKIAEADHAANPLNHPLVKGFFK